MNKLARLNYGFSPDEEKAILSIIDDAQRKGYATTPLLVVRRLIALGIETYQKQTSEPKKHAHAK